MAAVQVHPGRLSGPMTTAPTVLEVDRERLDLRCSDGDAPRCTFRAAYEVRNPTSASQTDVAAFYGLRSESIEVRVAGVSVGRALADAEQDALDAAITRADAAPRFAFEQDRAAQVTRVGFDLTVQAGARTEVVVTGVIRLEPRFVPSGYVWPAVQARHPWLHRARPRRVFDLDYLLGPIRTWARVGPIDVTVEHPDGWTMEGATLSADGVRDGGPGRAALPFAIDRSDGRTRARARTSADAGALLTLKMSHEGGWVHHGGPSLAVGGAVGPGGGFRTRVGYEFAAPGPLIYSLNADTDWTSRVIVTPMVELASPFLFLIPSFAIGVGLPVQLAPETLVGARVEGSFNFGPLGFVTALDLFPSRLSTAAPGGSQVTLYARWSM